jgi:hypothetical protein
MMMMVVVDMPAFFPDEVAPVVVVVTDPGAGAKAPVEFCAGSALPVG